MKRAVPIVASFAVLLSATAAFAENPLTVAVMKSYGEMKMNFIDAASLMPEESYGYRLTAGQQSFGEWMDHAGIANFYYCARLGGTPPPDYEAIRTMRGKTAKADRRKFLEESFKYCDAALVGMDDSKAAAPLTFGKTTIYPATFLVGLLTGLNEHYGNVVGYLRTKGITPPSTAREAKK